jgi:hypothetical protein
MLTEVDRMQLSPYLAKIREARTALPRAERAAVQAKQKFVSIRRNSTLWDRWFNRDGPTGLAYREARQASGAAAAAVTRTEKQIKAMYAALDRLLEPMMPRIDRGYEGRSLIIKSCARAARECRALRNPIETFVETVRDATQNGREVENARLRYPGHLVHARKAAVALKLALDPVREAAARSGTPAPGLRWNEAVFDRLPRTAEGMAALQRLSRAMPKLRGMPRHVDGLRADLIELARRTQRAQRAALIQARNRLIHKGWGTASPT